jgi:hypothetical protein
MIRSPFRPDFEPARADPSESGNTGHGNATDLDQNSVVCCLFLATVAEAGISKGIGNLSDPMNAQLDAFLKMVLQVP